MRFIYVSRKMAARVVVAACLAVVSLAYLRAAWPVDPAARDAGAPVSAKASGARQHPVYSVDRGKEKVLAISFDAAWGAEKTQGIMDILDDYGIRTTFFLVGFWIDAYPEQVAAIHDRGHEIGNHSTRHPRMTELSDAQMREELNVTADKIEDITGVRPVLFRCPFGDYDNRVLLNASNLGYTTVQWDVDSLDWKEDGTAKMVKRVVEKVKPGSIVLFHNNSRDILEALPIILNQIFADGYTVVPVSELLLSGDTKIDQLGIQRHR